MLKNIIQKGLQKFKTKFLHKSSVIGKALTADLKGEKLMINLKEKSGITLIALVVTIIIILIILTVVVAMGMEGSKEAKEDKLITELSTVQNAVLQQHYKYTLTGSSSDLVGTKVELSEIEDIVMAMGITLSEINVTGQEYDYYRLTPTELKEIGIKQAKDTYIVNYSTGEVINDTIRVVADSGKKLYAKGTSMVGDYGVPIPDGFKYKEGTVEKGLVITGPDNSEFVWVPLKKADIILEIPTGRSESQIKALIDERDSTREISNGNQSSRRNKL